MGFLPRRSLFPFWLLLALALCSSGWTAAAEFPLWLGGVAPAQPLNPGALSCPAPTDPLERALWQVTTEGGRPDHSCGNAFVGYLRTPGAPGQPDAFEMAAGQVRVARSEVLIANMEWHPGEGQPGWTFAQSVRDLYRAVQAQPGAYPQGMRVWVALGGYPDLKRSDGASAPLGLIRDLTRLGVPLNDPALGWQVAVANYRYFPHSHVKLLVIDGQDVTVAGYNYSPLHLPEHRGGRSEHDLGLRMRGPVAQDGVAMFDDLWRHSQELRCSAGLTAQTVERLCTLTAPGKVVHPEAARLLQPTGQARAFMLYRRVGFDGADRAQLALFGAARQNLDLMYVEFSPGLDCWYGFLTPEACPLSRFPSYMAAIMEAMKRGVHVRLLTVDTGIDRDANRSGIALMRMEARRLGIEDRFEARYTTFHMHTKAMTVDDRMVVAGSMNLHFSAWGRFGLNEAMLATTDPGAVAEQRSSFEDAWAHHSREAPREGWLRNVPGPAQ